MPNRSESRCSPALFGHPLGTPQFSNRLRAANDSTSRSARRAGSSRAKWHQITIIVKNLHSAPFAFIRRALPASELSGLNENFLNGASPASVRRRCPARTRGARLVAARLSKLSFRLKRIGSAVEAACRGRPDFDAKLLKLRLQSRQRD